MYRPTALAKLMTEYESISGNLIKKATPQEEVDYWCKKISLWAAVNQKGIIELLGEIGKDLPRINIASNRYELEVTLYKCARMYLKVSPNCALSTGRNSYMTRLSRLLR